MDSTHLPAKELDDQISSHPKTKVGPDINWDGNNLETSTEEESDTADYEIEDSTGKKDEICLLNGHVESNTVIQKKIEQSKSSKKTSVISEVKEDDEPSKGQNQLGDDPSSATKLKSWLGETHDPASEVEGEASRPNCPFSWKPPTPFSQVKTDLTSLPKQGHATLGD